MRRGVSRSPPGRWLELRTYAARGATIVTSALNSAYVEGALTSTHTLVPDELAMTESPSWEIVPVAPDAEFSLERGRCRRALASPDRPR